MDSPAGASKHYARKAGFDAPAFCTHALRATAATNALDRQADIARVQEWLGHAHIATTSPPTPLPVLL